MKLFNDTPFPVASTVFKTEPRSPILTLISKATFRLVPDGACQALPADEQKPPQPAVYFEDDFGNSLCTDAETAPFKPRADCLLTGSCHAPDGIPAPAVAIVFSIGEMRKTLWVYGDRHWINGGAAKYTSSDPKPFLSLPIRNEFAHGGFLSRYNKHGLGMVSSAVPVEPGDVIPLANIQDHKTSHVAPNKDTPPAGFGPLDPASKPRSDFAGTYDEYWLYRRKPLPPKDFRYDHFNAARPDQQIEGYLRGDEALYLQNLHPAHRHLNSRLPGLRIRCFLLQFASSDEGPQLDLLEATACLDTCTVDAEAETVTLIWRARAPLDPTERKQYTHALVAVEELAAPRDEQYYRKRLRALALGDAEALDPDDFDQPGPEVVATAREHAAKSVSEKMVQLFETGNAPPELLDIVKSEPDPMSALKKLVDAAEKMVADLPKIPE